MTSLLVLRSSEMCSILLSCTVLKDAVLRAALGLLVIFLRADFLLSPTFARDLQALLASHSRWPKDLPSIRSASPIVNSVSDRCNFVRRYEVLVAVVGAGIATSYGWHGAGFEFRQEREIFRLFQNRPA